MINSFIVCFLEESSFVSIFKYQILHLTLTINDDSIDSYIRKLSTNVFTTILSKFTNLIYLQFGLKDICYYTPRLSIDSVSTTYYPTNITHLNVRVRMFECCLYLLNGCLGQLQTFIVEIDFIRDTSMTINNTVIYFKLQKNSIFWPTFERRIKD